MWQAKGTSLHLRESVDGEQGRWCYLLLRYVLSSAAWDLRMPFAPRIQP